MRIHWFGCWGLLLFVVPADAQEIVQVTNGGGKNSTVSQVGRTGTNRVSISSTADLVPLSPTGPGNADGSSEAFLYDTTTGALIQTTNNPGPSSLATTPVAILSDGTFLVNSQADLTPGAPGHATGSSQSWTYLYTPATKRSVPSLLQLTPSTAVDLSFNLPQELAKTGRILFSSGGDLPAGTNADGSLEVFLYERESGTVRAVTAGQGDSNADLVFDRERRLLVESSSDLTGTGSNADGSFEIFAADLGTGTFEQLTHEPAGIDWFGIFPLDSKSRFMLLQRVDTNAVQTVTEYWVEDLRKRTFRKLLSETFGGVNEIKGFVPGSKSLVVGTKADLVPQSLTTPGNADHSLEVFTVDSRTGVAVQRTAASQDVAVRFLPRSKSLPAVLTSKADLAPGAPGNAGGVQQVYLLPLGPKLTVPVQATNGDRDSSASGVDDKGDVVAITSKGDLVPASLSTPGNANHVQQIFLLTIKGAPTLRQVTVADKDVTFKGFLHDGRSFLVQTKADLTPGKPGNPNGGTEIYRIFYR